MLLTMILLVLGPGIQKVRAASPGDIFRSAAPAVVMVYVETGPGKGRAGTGSIITPDGYVITNAHVVRGAYKDRISVFLKPERLSGVLSRDLSRRYRGKLVTMDRAFDLALIKIVRPPARLPVVRFGMSGDVMVGDPVFVIGHPEQGGLWSLTRGIISARWSNYGGIKGKDVFQTDAGINRGNSGGPLLDSLGRMVGVNAMIARKAADGLAITDINFAIQSNVALRWLQAVGITKVRGLAGRPGEKPAKSETKEPKRAEVAGAQSRSMPEKETPSPVEQKLTASDNGNQVGEKRRKPQKKPVKKKIITKLRPYSMDDLEREIREMEDFMLEMRGVMEEYKKHNKTQ